MDPSVYFDVFHRIGSAYLILATYVLVILLAVALWWIGKDAAPALPALTTPQRSSARLCGWRSTVVASMAPASRTRSQIGA